MIVSWIINFKSIQHGDTVVRGRKYQTDSFLSCVHSIRQARPRWWQLFLVELILPPPLQESPMSHSSHSLISLLLSIGVVVIGYFTHVRVELAEGKGQATRLSVSCTTVIHQLLSGTRKGTAALIRHFVKPNPGLPG